MKKPTIAVISFPGNNCEYESLRAIARSGMTPLYFRWNDDRAKLREVDGYFLVGGFSYEDRGRSGMVAARDSLLDFIGRGAEEGKVVIGNCNGAQILVESGLIPLDRGLRMSLARNVTETDEGRRAPGFLSEWVWITPSCPPDRCATSGWTGAMHLPIAHGEGRFVTADTDVAKELKKNNQIAFSYCDADGITSEDAGVTPNGSQFGGAGICNPAGNVIALMPHPERTGNGKPYFDSMRLWIEGNRTYERMNVSYIQERPNASLDSYKPLLPQLFIDTIIVNNEERTVEQTARKYAPGIKLKQWKYFSADKLTHRNILSDLSLFNANKERAFIRREGKTFRWNTAAKKEEELTAAQAAAIFGGTLLLRRDLPDTAGERLGDDAVTGVCYGISGVNEQNLESGKLLEVFYNPNASELKILR